MGKILCKACGLPLKDHSWQYLDLVCAKKLTREKGGKQMKYTKEEIKEGCKNCKYCHKDEWEHNRPWCKYGHRPETQPSKGTYNCVFWNK